MIQANVGRYEKMNDLTVDMRLILTNATEYNGRQHPVSKAAEQLFETYLRELSDATGRLISTTAASGAASSMFACPRCHLAICSTCKRTEHTGAPCDTSQTDHELAMLQTFGYKRCPRCKAGVKKMYGCSHMQCICGAHWCYWCQRAIEECDGACAEADNDSEDDEEGYDSEDDVVEPRVEGSAADAPQALTGTNVAVAQTRLSEDRPVSNNVTVNLDAGGGRRWADTGHDFGDEPEDPFSQIWSCRHNFETYQAPPDDGYRRGNLDRMECNRCFRRVEAQKSQRQPDAKKRRRSTFPLKASEPLSEGPLPEQEAWECTSCRVLLCVGCRDQYLKRQSQK